MNKGEFISALAEKCNITKLEAAAMVNASCGIITEAVAAGNSVKLLGFGAFAPVDRAPRVATSFRGKRIEIPAKKAVVFSASKSFKDLLNPPKRKRGRPRKGNA